MDKDEKQEQQVDIVVIVVVVICILLLPVLLFGFCRLRSKLKRKTHKRASRVSVVSIAPMNRPRKSSIVLPPIRHAPSRQRNSTELSTVEAPDSTTVGKTDGTTTSSSFADSRRFSNCRLAEMKLMDVGPLPHDQAALEEQRARELEKRQSLANQVN